MNPKQTTAFPAEQTASDIKERFQEQGFRDAFGVLWQHHRGRLGAFVRGRGLSEDRADDLMQNIGFKLFRYLSGHIVEIFPPTAYKITKDEIADFYRALNRLPTLETLDDLVTANLEPSVAPVDARHERWHTLQTKMRENGVSDEQQTAVILHHLIGYTLDEVALITGAKREAVKSRLRYAALKMGRAVRHKEAS